MLWEHGHGKGPVFRALAAEAFYVRRVRIVSVCWQTRAQVLGLSEGANTSLFAVFRAHDMRLTSVSTTLPGFAVCQWPEHPNTSLFAVFPARDMLQTSVFTTLRGFVACDWPEHPCPHDDNVRVTRASMSAHACPHDDNVHAKASVFTTLRAFLLPG